MRASPIDIRRAELEARIEDLIGLLDLLDNDPDLEPEESGYGDFDALLEDEKGEPSLGWTTAIDQSSPYRLGDSTQPYDLELDDSDTEPNGDENDYNGYEGEIGVSNNGFFDGSGGAIARKMLAYRKRKVVAA